MKKILFLFLSVLFLSGCATYKYQHGKKPYDQGYVITRNNQTVLEYTLGENDTVPDKDLAKERFKRRRKTVEVFYKKMGYIESYTRLYFWNHVVSMAEGIVGIFRMPAIAISEYKYAHNPKYKERVIKLEDEQEAKEETRVSKIKDDLREYVKKDLAREKGKPRSASVREVKPKKIPAKPRIAAPASAPEATVNTGTGLQSAAPSVTSAQAEAIPPAAAQAQAKPQPQKRVKPKAVQAKSPVISRQPVAVITAKPQKGYSPLMVRFSGKRSYSPDARIVSYSWDFGDSDSSNKSAPSNTYWSGSFEPRYYNVILTVKDSNGNTAQANTTIEVMNK